MSNEDVKEDEDYDSEEERAGLNKEVTRLQDELDVRVTQIDQLKFQTENNETKLKMAEKKANEWERVAAIVTGIGKDEDDLLKILREKDKLELVNEKLKQKLQDLQQQIENFDASRAEERKHTKELEVKLRDAKITLSDTEDIRKGAANTEMKIRSLKSKADKADSAVKAEKTKTQRANQEKAKATFESTQAKKKITRQLESLKQQKTELDKLKATMDEITSERDTLRAQFRSTQEEYEVLTRTKGDLEDKYKSDERRFQENFAQADMREKEITLLKQNVEKCNEKLREAAGWKNLHAIVDELAPKETEKAQLEAEKIHLRAQMTKEQDRTRHSKKEAAEWEEKYNEKHSNLYDVLARNKKELQDLKADMKGQISKANTHREYQQQRADELDSELCKKKQEMFTYQTELQSYKKNQKHLDIRIEELEEETSQLQEERDSMRDIVDCTQTEMTTLLGALKNMEVALDRMKANDRAVEDAKFLTEKCSGLETQVKNYQKQLNENMDRYMKGLKEQKARASEQLTTAKDSTAAIAAAMGTPHKEEIGPPGSEPPTPRPRENAKEAQKKTAAVAKLRAERDVLKGELDRCYKSLTNTRMQRDNLEMSLMSRDTEISALRTKLQGVLRSVQSSGMSTEATVLQGLMRDMGKFGPKDAKPKRVKGGKSSVGARVAQRNAKPAPRGAAYAGAQQGPRKVYGGHKAPKGARRGIVGRRRGVTPEE